MSRQIKCWTKCNKFFFQRQFKICNRQIQMNLNFRIFCAFPLKRNINLGHLIVFAWKKRKRPIEEKSKKTLNPFVYVIDCEKQWKIHMIAISWSRSSSRWENQPLHSMDKLVELCYFDGFSEFGKNCMKMVSFFESRLLTHTHALINPSPLFIVTQQQQHQTTKPLA